MFQTPRNRHSDMESQQYHRACLKISAMIEAFIYNQSTYIALIPDDDMWCKLFQ